MHLIDYHYKDIGNELSTNNYIKDSKDLKDHVKSLSYISG